MKKQQVIWECVECGHTQYKWTGSCVKCKNWNSFVEQILFDKSSIRYGTKEEKKGKKAISLCEVNIKNTQRIYSNIPEMNRLMGGGAVVGSFTLICGEPGVGKSTLLLQIASSFAEKNMRVLYICGEESEEQTSLRAKRLGINHPNVFLLHETQLGAIKQQIEDIHPHVIIVDSVQILYKEELPSSPGSVVQVREIASEFLHISKKNNITTFMIGHVTKTGDIAGPRVLEHIVDTVLEFEGDKHLGVRLLRVVKNRFGPTDEVALFSMKENGLEEIQNPSATMLQERDKKIAGSAIVSAMEGGRAFLIEVQALVTRSVFPSPARRNTGLDQNRLTLLLAVLEKKLNYRLYNSDIFVSVAGGMRILEPAIDLGVILSVASSFSNRVIDAETIVFGEVGLGGEIRRISRVEARIKEAVNMGFKRCLLPRKNLKQIAKNLEKKIELIGVDQVEDAIYALLPKR